MIARPLPPHPASDQRGIALVMALMTLLAISVLSLLLLMSLTVETKISGYSYRNAQALNVAEAGVGEALARIRNFEIPNTMNPRQVSQIFLAPPGSVPVLGPDSVALATGQPPGGWMNYSTASKDSDDVLTVTYKTNATRTGLGWIPAPPTLIYRFDPSRNPPVQPNSGLPIFVVTSTGRKGQQARRIQTEVIQRPFNTRMEAAMATKSGIEFSGNADVCGYNHRMATPAFTSGVHGTGFCDPWEQAGDELPGAWSEGTITSSGAARQKGSPLDIEPGQANFYAGPWEALGITQAEFFAWVGSPQPVPPLVPVGVTYVDNDGLTQNQSGSFAYHGGNGEGLLYMDGDLTINGNFTFRGLVYVEGDLTITGNCWILGGLIVHGRGPVKVANGDLDVLYSRDTVVQNIAKYGGQFLTLAWRELFRQ